MRHSRPVADRDAQFDLIIAGGGMTGLALACTVAGANVPVLLIEQRPLPDTTALAFDGRVTAIARGSRHLLEGIGIWPYLAEEAQPILDIEVGERHSPLTVHYDHRAVGGEPLGHIVENRVIRRALLRRLAELSDWRAGGRSARALGADRAPGGCGRDRRSRADSASGPACSRPPTGGDRLCATSSASG